MKMVRAGPSAALVVLLAASCGLIVANIYYAQPLVGVIGPAIGLGSRAAGLIVTLSQLGYAAGLLLLVPVGDLVENRRLVVLTVLASIPALLIAACAHSAAWFLAAAALVGLASVAVQMLVPLAAHLAPEETRGRVVGNVMSGLLLGILLSRPAASLLTNFFGWRAVFAVSAGVMALVVLLLRATLPVRQPDAREHYGALLASMVRLTFTMPALRRRAAYQFAAFGCFSLFWTAAPLLLARRFHYTQRGIAVFALAGAAGALAAPIAGRLADRGFGRAGTAVALVTIPLSFLIAWGGSQIHSVVVLALAGMLLDAAVQSNLVFGQRVIYTLAPEIRSRLNGVFMAIFFTGGAAGSAVTGPVLVHDGWPGVCLLGAILPLCALGYFLLRDR